MRRHSVINVATFPVNEEGHELFPKTTTDCFMSEGRNTWIMPFPQTIAKIKPKEMAPVPYIFTDISYLNWNILQNPYGILNMDLE